MDLDLDATLLYKKSDLESTDLDGQLDGERLCCNRLLTVILLQELAHCLRVPSDGVRLPLVVGPARVRLHQHSDSCFFKRQRHEILGTIFSMSLDNIFVFIFQEFLNKTWKDFS